MPKNLAINYWAKTLEDAERVTEIHEFSPRRLKEKINQGVFLDADLSEPDIAAHEISKADPGKMILPEHDDTTPYIILEQHGFLDLDDDGYPEPYVVFVEKTSQKVLRIAPRFSTEGVQVDEKGSVISIEPDSYYTKFSFFPNPDGGFYDIGFGRLLGPINASVDTIINQLVDAGTLSNLQSGFIGKGLRIRMGDTKFSPGEWKVVNSTGTDIKGQVFPLPVREPSAVLFKLLELLSTSAKELASVAEIFVGKMPGQNTPATTTAASIEQGMKLFTSVYKRIYRSLTREFRKLYKLNRMYLDDSVELDILDEPIPQSDYKGSENDILPAADPTAASQQERLQKIQQVMQLLALGTINPMEVSKRMLEALEEPGIDQLLMQPQPQPDPKAEALKMKAEIDQQKAVHASQIKEREMALKEASEQEKAALKREMHEMDLHYKEQDAILKARIAKLEAASGQQQHEQSLIQNEQNHRQSLIQNQDKHQQSLQQQKEAQKAKPQPKPSK